MDGSFVLEIKNVTKSFPGVLALDQVSLNIKHGTVHALMGENGAGKSTLMNCLFGIYKIDEGEFFLNGKKATFHSTQNALEAGVSMIHQELMNVPDRCVKDNLWLGREPVRNIGPFKMLNHKQMYEDTLELFKKLEMDLNPDEHMRNLSISLQQSSEIARAVSYNARVVVMDEPTSSLSEKEVIHLFKIINDLKSRGVSIIYISHKMDEIFKISDEVSVMRDGKMIGTFPTESIDEDQLIKHMVGRDNAKIFPYLGKPGTETVLSVENITSVDPKSFRNISFELKKGEILGIGGLVGAQRTELVEAIFGVRKIASGQIIINGKKIEKHTPFHSIKKGLALITEDRRGSGIFPLLNITMNTVMASLGSFVNSFGLLNHKEIKKDTQRLNNSLKTKMPNMNALIQNLSGGNQQKVIISRWLLTEPDILIMDEPTRGIDVGAKFEIYTIISELVKNGKSIILVSSEMMELLGVSHRIMVLCDGRHTGTINRSDASQEKIMKLASRFAEGDEDGINNIP